MNLKLAKMICKRQGIKMHVEVPVICPRCNRKSLILDIKEDKANCLYCKKKYKSIEEVATLERERWMDQHRKTKNEMEARKGVRQ